MPWKEQQIVALYKLLLLLLLTYGHNTILQGMFVPAIKGQGTEEQQQKWLPLAYKFQIIGCYAQTELGHGSNVQGLETTATFDPKTDEFVIHSPTLTSSKVKFYESTATLLIRLKHLLFSLFKNHFSALAICDVNC